MPWLNPHATGLRPKSAKQHGSSMTEEVAKHNSTKARWAFINIYAEQSYT